MKRKLLFICMVSYLSFIATYLFAETDILGWGKARWGMTYSQIAKLYDIEDFQNDPPRCFKKEQTVIQGHSFNVVFFFDNFSLSGKLNKVVVQVVKEGKEKYDSVFRLLVGKYGKPDFDKVNALGIHHIFWLRPSGQLEYYVYELRGMVACCITYAAKSSDSEKL
jgi:hypothetical protein